MSISQLVNHTHITTNNNHYNKVILEAFQNTNITNMDLNSSDYLFTHEMNELYEIITYKDLADFEIFEAFEEVEMVPLDYEFKTTVDMKSNGRG